MKTSTSIKLKLKELFKGTLEVKGTTKLEHALSETKEKMEDAELLLRRCEGEREYSETEIKRLTGTIADYTKLAAKSSNDETKLKKIFDKVAALKAEVSRHETLLVNSEVILEQYKILVKTLRLNVVDLTNDYNTLQAKENLSDQVEELAKIQSSVTGVNAMAVKKEINVDYNASRIKLKSMADENLDIDLGENDFEAWKASL